MSARMSTLDTDKLRKVRALMDGGKTAGERLAAKTKAEGIAARAGMTLQAALSTLDSKPTAQAPNIFAGFDDWMEAKEPGWKAKQARQRAKREAARLARCRDLLKIYGSEDAVFAETDHERAVREALAPLAEPGTMWGYRDYRGRQPTPAMLSALGGAVSAPATVPEAWAAYQAHEALTDARIAFCPDYTPEHPSDAWRGLLRHLLDTLPTPTVEGVRARLDWLSHLANEDCARDVECDRVALAALRADFEALAAPVASGQGKGAPDRFEALAALLRASPGLSDREMARRVGCSPQTVGNWRRRMRGKP
ncbi:helix-turn-helix domain-containing protein [Frigidibacter sp. MR17.24]|uniref:helix-turn-helix domain-containing protein n=1 Tax=Frigidibacter sp. MR17.24 TaxID=3127345 RepID=UPI003012B970